MSSREGKTIYQFIDDHVLTDKSSFDIQEMIEHIDTLDRDSDEGMEWFCYHLDLGDWFIEALMENQVSIIEALANTKARKELEEKEAIEERAETDRDLRLAQGAAY